MNNTPNNKYTYIDIPYNIIMKNPKIIFIFIAAFFIFGSTLGMLIEIKTNNKNIEIYISQEELSYMIQNKDNSINYKLIIKEK